MEIIFCTYTQFEKKSEDAMGGLIPLTHLCVRRCSAISSSTFDGSDQETPAFAAYYRSPAGNVYVALFAEKFSRRIVEERRMKTSSSS